MTTDAMAHPKLTERRDVNGALIPAPPDLGALARQIGAKLAAASAGKASPRAPRPAGATQAQMAELAASARRHLPQQARTPHGRI